ncbi:MAG: mannose-phosphate guanyltransferase [Burkholderia sp.]|nr:mannose-phosphate guanyltransferase [Burkholderia sp.]
MILAAGKGTRVRPLTHELPKPMIPLLGKPLMAYLVEHLARHGVQEIMVNVSYFHEKIEQYFGEGQRFGLRIGYSFEGYTEEGKVVPHALGSAGGMKKIHEFGRFFDDTTIVLCGDALIDLDIESAVREHRRKGAHASVITAQVPWHSVSDYGIVVSDEDGRVRSFQEKPSQHEALSNYASTGIYIFEPEVLNLIPSGQQFDIGSELFPLLVTKGVPFYAQNRVFNWIDIGKVSDYWNVLQRVMRDGVAGMQIPGRHVRDGLWVGLNTRIDWDGTSITGPVYVGSGCHIEAGTEIVGPTWIGHGSHLRAGTKVVRSALFDYTRVASGVTLEEVIVCNDYCVDRKGEMRHVSDADSPCWSDARDRRTMPEVLLCRA